MKSSIHISNDGNTIRLKGKAANDFFKSLMPKEKPKPSEIWNEIKGKAHLYQTAYMGNHCVRILGVACDGTFNIAHPVFGQMDAGCHELTDYCL